MVKSIEVKCKYCGYEWETKTIKKNVTCPSCLNKTLVDETINFLLNKEVKENDNKT